MSERHFQFISRSLLLGWTLWLIVSFALNLRLDGGRPVANAITMRWTLESALAGVMLAWPMLRLSQQAPAYPTFATTGDVAGLLGLFQLVFLPVGMMRVYWSVEQTTAIMLAFFAYTFATALVVDTARRRGGFGRLAGMVVCVAMYAGGLLSAGEPTGLWLLLSPPRAVWYLSGDATPITAWATVAPYAIGAAVCVVAWVLMARLGRPRGKPETADPPANS